MEKLVSLDQTKFLPDLIIKIDIRYKHAFFYVHDMQTLQSVRFGKGTDNFYFISEPSEENSSP